METATKTATKTSNPAAIEAKPRLSFEEMWAMMEKIMQSIDELRKRDEENAREREEEKRKYEEEKRKRDEELRKRDEENARKYEEEKRKRDEEERKREEKYAEEERKRGEIIDRRLAKLSEQFGICQNSIGALVEQIVTPNLHRKFRKRGYSFDSVTRNREFTDKTTGAYMTEVDVFLEDGDYVMAVEVKSKLHLSDIKHHVKRMKLIRRYFDMRGDTRKCIGAIAAPSAEQKLREAIYAAGFFFIEPSEKAVNIIVPDGFKPREW